MPLSLPFSSAIVEVESFVSRLNRWMRLVGADDEEIPVDEPALERAWEVGTGAGRSGWGYN